MDVTYSSVSMLIPCHPHDHLHALAAIGDCLAVSEWFGEQGLESSPTTVLMASIGNAQRGFLDRFVEMGIVRDALKLCIRHNLTESSKSMMRWLVHRHCIEALRAYKEESESDGGRGYFLDLCLHSMSPTRFTSSSWVFDGDADVQFYVQLAGMLGGTLNLIDVVYTSEVCTMVQPERQARAAYFVHCNVKTKHPNLKLRYISYVARCKSRTGLEQWCRLARAGRTRRITEV